MELRQKIFLQCMYGIKRLEWLANWEDIFVGRWLRLKCEENTFVQRQLDQELVYLLEMLILGHIQVSHSLASGINSPRSLISPPCSSIPTARQSEPGFRSQPERSQAASEPATVSHRILA